jgi:hypothetical protein
LAAAAQSRTARFETDINGRRVEMTSSTVSPEGQRSELLQSINGRLIPLEQVQEKVISEGPGGRVVERIVKKYDQTGRLGSTEKVRIEEHPLSNGGQSVRETTWRSDINGNFVEAERRTAETRVSGGVTTTETATSRPTLNGTYEITEKRSRVSQKTGDREQTRESVERPRDGRFYEAIREVSVTTTSDGQTREERTTYEPGQTGQLELHRQSVSTSVKRPDGSELTEVTMYSRSADGRSQPQGARPQLKEQQIIERTTAPDGSIVESLSVRRPTIADPDRLGPVRKLSETVCKGKCQ